LRAQRGRDAAAELIDIDYEALPSVTDTAEEQLIVVRGAVMAEMTDHQPTRLGPGGFAMMGTHIAHQFACQGTAACVMFVSFDRAYDIKWGKAA